MKRLCLALLAVATAACATTVKVAPVKVEPIHVKVDVTVKDEGEQPAAEAASPSEPPAAER